MNVYKHTAVSLTASALILVIAKNAQMSIACFLTGVLIDVDHVFDYCVNRALPDLLVYLHRPGKLTKFLSHEYLKFKPYSRVYKPLHSIELLIPASLLYTFGIWNNIATGALIGFVAHIIMDSIPLGHIGVISIIYKIKRKFPTGSEILKYRLSKIGKDVSKCQSCGAYGETIAHRTRRGHIGFTKRGLSKVMILCPDCHDRIHSEEA